MRAIITLPQEARPSVDGEPLAEGFEIAAYTSDGICAGRAVWTGGSVALVVWGNDSQTEQKDGFNPGDRIEFRIWDPSTGEIYEEDEVTVSFSRERNFFTTERYFEEGGIYVLSGLHVGEPLGDTEIEYVYPNPTTTHANTRFSLNEPGRVQLHVYDLLGRRIATVVDDELSMGHYTFRWDARDNRGSPVSSGTYFIRLETPSAMSTKPVTVVR